MKYMTSGNETVDAMGMMNISGNVIPQIWYSTITRENGKPYLLAITLPGILFTGIVRQRLEMREPARW